MAMRSRALPALITLVGCLADAVVARADEPLPPSADTNPAAFPESPAQPNLILIGAAVTAGWYGGAVGMSYLWPDSPGGSDLRIPVAGPYMALARTGCGDNEPSCGTFLLVFRTILTGLSAVGQTGGILAMVEGAFLPTASSGAAKVPALRGSASGSAVIDKDSSSFTVLPFVSANDAVGFGMSGSF